MVESKNKNFKMQKKRTERGKIMRKAVVNVERKEQRQATQQVISDIPSGENWTE